MRHRRAAGHSHHRNGARRAQSCGSRGHARRGAAGLGSLDYALDLGLSPDSPGAGIVLDHARIQVLLQTRAAGLPPALDGVFPGVQDTAGLARAASRAQQMGFGGMLCIHPAQVPLIHQAFAPAAAELDWARRVLAAHRDGGPGAFMLDGRMVDAPVIARARQVLAQAGESV